MANKITSSTPSSEISFEENDEGEDDDFPDQFILTNQRKVVIRAL